MEENKKGKGKNVLIVFLVILVLGFAGYISYDKYFYKYFEKENVKKLNKKESNKSKLTDLDIDSKEVKELYEKLVDYSDGVMYPLGSVYNSYKTTYDNVKKALISKACFNKYLLQEPDPNENYDPELDENAEYATCEEVKNENLPEVYQKNCADPTNIHVIRDIDIKDELIKLIGKEQEKKFKYVSFSPDVSIFCVYNNGYTCYGIDGGDANPGYSMKKIIKAQKDEKENVYIYDNYLLAYNNIDTDKIEIYNTYNKDIKLKTLEIEEVHPESIQDYISKYGDKDINTFKHTFKKDSAGNYYWYSTEVVEK